MTTDTTLPEADVTHFISAKPDMSGNRTLCGADHVFPMRGNGWRVKHVTCADCSRMLCDLGHEAMRRASPPPAEVSATVVASGYDYERIYSEARRRMMRDVTGGFYDEHLARTAFEHGHRAALKENPHG